MSNLLKLPILLYQYCDTGDLFKGRAVSPYYSIVIDHMLYKEA
jgi:hypothetical protein